MIIEDYVSFEIAKMLKEKGFDESCQNLYRKTREILSCGTVNLPELTNSQLDNLKTLQAWVDKMFIYTCPTLQMAMKWLRKEYNFHIDPYPENNNTWCLIIWELYPKQVKQCNGKYDNRSYSTYEEACEEAIKYILKNLI